MGNFSRREMAQGAFGVIALGASGGLIRNAVAAHRTAQPLHLGCCYYPEQWDEARWATDARDMVARGISRARIGEFAWTLMEPEPNRFDWGWLDRAVGTLVMAGLGVVLGTPTACPPEWLVARHPEILPVGKDGRVRGFGSRRYYSFASLPYRAECVRIATAMADRYGKHEGVIGWQIDNEYGCHDTTYSYGPADLAGFRAWLRSKYGTIAKLNAAWGNVVWSQQVPDFDAISLPVSSPYDFPPAMMLDFRRFASDQVVAFHKAQADVVRPRSPGRFITTNFMGNFTDFDQYSVGDAIDLASWDSYPLGLAAAGDDPQWDRTGNPDVTGWNHDMMRGLNPAPFWIMEQQPGAINWARYNPLPLPGMVRLWTWEAFAHGASTVSYFRWRQGQVGPEQMHAGLNRTDGHISPGGEEAARVAGEIARIGAISASGRGDVALLFDYESVWMSDIQPNGTVRGPLSHAQAWYAALRQLGLDVDIVRPGTALRDYRLVVVPSVWTISDRAFQSLKDARGLIVLGPRTGSKSGNFAIPSEQPPGRLQGLISVKVGQVEITRPGSGASISGDGVAGNVSDWREWLETASPVRARYADGEPAVVGGEGVWYVGCQGDAAFAASLMKRAACEAGLATQPLPAGVRVRRRGALHFAFNYGSSVENLPVDRAARFLLGGVSIQAHDLAVWTNI